jgi:hypothetical protein
MASHASCPAGVLELPDFLKLVKKSIGGIGFRFVPLDVFVVSVTVQLPASRVNMYAGLSQQAVLTFDSMHAYVLSPLTTTIRGSESLHSSLSMQV